MSIMNKLKYKKLQSLVFASVVALSFNSSTMAAEVRNEDLINVNYNTDDFFIGSAGHYDLGGNFDVSYGNLDFSKEFEISLPNGRLYYTPTEKRVHWSQYGDTVFKAGGLYYIGVRTYESSLDPDSLVTYLGDAESILKGGISKEEVEDLIHNVEGDQTVNGSQTVTGDQTVNGDSTIKGDNTTDGDSNVKGDGNIGGDLTVGEEGVDKDGDGNPDRPGNLEVAGDETVNGNETVKGDSNVGGNQSVTGDSIVKGDEYVHGNEIIGEDLTVKGDEYVKGDEVVSGDSTTKGDEYVYGDEVVSGDSTTKGDGTVGGDMNVGYEGVDEDGDGAIDRPGNLDVAGDSHLTGDTQVGNRDDQGNVTDYSDFDVTGNTHLGGDTGVGFDGVDKDGDGHPDRYGNLDVAGDATVGIRDQEGNVEEASDLDVTGNSNLGGDTIIGYDGVDTDGDGVIDRPGNLDVAGDSQLKGDTQVGNRDENGNVTDYSNFDVTGSADVGGDAYVGFDGVDADGDGTPDRPGNMYIAGDTVIGVPGVPGAESNLHVTGSTTIDHDLYVGDEGHFDGNLYAPDFIFNGGKSLTGEIDRLDGRIDTAGANAAALAGLHPLDFDEDQKLNFAAAAGSYQGASAMALGMFYRPDDRTMFNIGGTFGNHENMATLGISFALDGPNAVKRSSKKNMQEQIVMLTAANAEMAQENAQMQAELAELKAMVMEMKAEKAA